MGNPLKITELVAQLPGTYYVARHAVHTPLSVRKLKKAVKAAFENQKLNKGMSFIEIVSNCNSGWKMTPIQANKWMEENMFRFIRSAILKLTDKLVDKTGKGITPTLININMNEEIIIAGFGGQGVFSMGKILAYAGMMQNMEVSWMPSYGPEMRGGTANVTVILSDERISSPILNRFDTAILLNQQSMDKFETIR